MSDTLKIAGGIVLGFMVLLIGCGLLIDAGTEDVNQPINEQGETGEQDTSGGGGDGEAEEEPAADFEPIKREGNGSQQLSPIKVPADATLSWTNDEDPAFRMFMLMDEAFEVSVSSEAPEGETFVPEGTYRFDVAGGDWSFTIRPATD